MNKIRPQLFLALTLTHAFFISRGQDIRPLVDSFFLEISSGKTVPIPPEILTPMKGSSVLEMIKPYLADSSNWVRGKAHDVVHRIASHAPTSSPVRMHGIIILTESLKDKDASNVRSALRYLTTYGKGDFSKEAKDSLINRIKLKPADLDQLIKLAGFLNLTQIKDEIRPYAQAGNPKQIRWAVLLALARMGDAAALKDLMQRVSKLPVNDDVVYKIFPDLIYTRQKKSLDYMIEALNSDVKNCMSADAEKEVEIFCGYRIMEQLAPVIQDYPFKLDLSGDLQTDDYPSALSTVRNWFRAHKDYTILTDHF
jgi:hypothetical protein